MSDANPMPPVWEAGVDGGAYWVKVERIAPYEGVFTVTRRDGDVEVNLHTSAVGISYDAPFGPDAMDVVDWEERALKIIDRDIVERSGA